MSEVEELVKYWEGNSNTDDKTVNLVSKLSACELEIAIARDRANRAPLVSRLKAVAEEKRNQSGRSNIIIQLNSAVLTLEDLEEVITALG